MDKCKIDKIEVFNFKKELKDICIYYFSSKKLDKRYTEEHSFFNANKKNGLTYYFNAFNYRDLNKKAKIINDLALTNGLNFLIRAFKQEKIYSCFVWFTDFEKNQNYHLSDFYRLIEN